MDENSWLHITIKWSCVLSYHNILIIPSTILLFIFQREDFGLYQQENALIVLIILEVRALLI